MGEQEEAEEQHEQQQDAAAREPSLGALSNILPNLQSLEAPICLALLPALLSGHNNLRSLKLQHCGSSSSQERDTGDSSDSGDVGPSDSSAAAPQQLLSSLPALEELQVDGVLQADLDALLEAVAASCSKLRSLHWKCRRSVQGSFTGSGLQTLAAGLCKDSLQSLCLELEGAKCAVPLGSVLPALQQLKALHWPELRLQADQPMVPELRDLQQPAWLPLARVVDLMALPSVARLREGLLNDVKVLGIRSMQ